MAMPLNLVFVRHGESEGNFIKRELIANPDYEVHSDFATRHDWQYRLSPRGIEQAEMAGAWLTETFGPIEEAFDERYVSPYLRARETAAYVGGTACSWLVDDRLPERDWGIYNTVPPHLRADVFPHTERMRQISSLKWRPDGGEALMSEVFLRFRDWLDTLHREQGNKQVLAVAHGELMWVARYVLERMLPEEWDEADQDDDQKIFNCDIIWYSRINPSKPDDISQHLSWRRIIRPTNQGVAPFGGEWVKLDGKRRFTGAQLAEAVEIAPRLI